MQFASFDCSWILSSSLSEHALWHISKVLFGIYQSSSLWLCSSWCAKHDGHSSGFSRRVSFVRFWLAKAGRVIGSPEPCPERQPHRIGHCWWETKQPQLSATMIIANRCQITDRKRARDGQMVVLTTWSQRWQSSYTDSSSMLVMTTKY